MKRKSSKTKKKRERTKGQPEFEVWDPKGPKLRAYSIADDGQRTRVKGRKILVELGDGSEVEVALFEPHPVYQDSLCVAVRGDLVVHPAAGNMVYLSVRRFGVLKDSPLG